MLRRAAISLVFCLVGLLNPFVAFGARKNCKLTIRTLTTSGKAKVEVLETVAESREDCRLQAKDREVIKNPEEISNIRVSFSYSEAKKD
jgi:hypothetical protein